MEIWLENRITEAYQKHCPYEQSSSWTSALVPWGAITVNCIPFFPLFFNLYNIEE